MEYKDVLSVKEAIETGELNTDTVGVFVCKGELFINDERGKSLFSAYYGTINACEDVCALLGLDEPEQV